MRSMRSAPINRGRNVMAIPIASRIWSSIPPSWATAFGRADVGITSVDAVPPRIVIWTLLGKAEWAVRRSDADSLDIRFYLFRYDFEEGCFAPVRRETAAFPATPFSDPTDRGTAIRGTGISAGAERATRGTETLLESGVHDSAVGTSASNHPAAVANPDRSEDTGDRSRPPARGSERSDPLTGTYLVGSSVSGVALSGGVSLRRDPIERRSRPSIRRRWYFRVYRSCRLSNKG